MRHLRRQAGALFPASEVCKDVPSYLRFIAESRGEIGIAKEGYIVSRGGWMSDRSVVYLALGRPVVLQETGWTRAIAPSEGMLVFHDIRDCAEAIQLIEADYEAHSRAAEALADTVFSPQRSVEAVAGKNSLVWRAKWVSFRTSRGSDNPISSDPMT